MELLHALFKDRSSHSKTSSTVFDLLKKYATIIELQAHVEVTQREATEPRSNPPDESTSWTTEDTAKALANCSYEKHLGLCWYDQDPIPMLKSYGKGKRFVDHEFPVQANDLSVTTPGIITQSNRRDFIQGHRSRRVDHYLTRARDWTWKRLNNHALLDRVEPMQVLQGAVGNCGFCAALSALAATAPSVIARAFRSEEEESSACLGAISLRLFVRGKFRYLLMDDFLLCYKDSYESPSMHSPDPHVTWVRFIEKAFVKMQGSYASLDGLYKYKSLYRHPVRALQCLTGSNLAMEVHFKGDCDLFRILTRTQDQFVRVVHCRRTQQGLRSNHGYSLLWVGEVGKTTSSKEEAATCQLVVLRNPHGRHSYRGNFGHGCRRWTTVEGKAILKQLGAENCLQSCDLDALDPTVGRRDNGIFCMEFESFVQCFPIMTLVEIEASEESRSQDCIYQLKTMAHLELVLDAIGA